MIQSEFSADGGANGTEILTEPAGVPALSRTAALMVMSPG
ncbi:Uncharacterised protein [Bordetella pertussis]|nr:Uncharacterised protein [Bordetella pertussis]